MHFWSYRIFLTRKQKHPKVSVGDESISLDSWKVNTVPFKNETIQHMTGKKRQKKIQWSGLCHRSYALGFIKCLSSNCQRYNKNALLLGALLGCR